MSDKIDKILDTTQSVAKATEESAKTLRELDPKWYDLFNRFGSYVGDTTSVIRETGLLLGNVVGLLNDRIRPLRKKAAEEVIFEADKILAKEKITEFKKPSLKNFTLLLEYASLEEDEIIKKLWAQLLANMLNPNFEEEIKMAYIEILKSLTPIDAKVLKLLYDFFIREQSKKHLPEKLKDLISASASGLDDTRYSIFNHSISKEVFIKELKISEAEYAVSVDNLLRLRCVCFKVHLNNTVETLDESKRYNSISLTYMGLTLVSAVS